MNPLKLLFDGNLTKGLENFSKFKEKLSQCLVCLSESDLNRKNIVTELYQTEVMYLLQLEILIKFFMQPINSAQSLPLAMYQVIFGNIESLYGINRQLLDALNETPSEPEKAFSVLGPFFKLYSVYACNYKKSIDYLMRIEKDFKKVAEFIHNQETRPEVATSLASLLIAPVQRVPRYRLILQALLKQYSAIHQERNIVKDAYDKVSDCAEHMNKLVLEAEDGEALVTLARRLGNDGLDLVIPGRKIIKQGILMRTSRDGNHGHSRFVVLFSDALLISKGEKEGPLSLTAFLPLKQIEVSAVLDSSTLIKVTVGTEMFFLFTSDTTSGREWLSSIVTAQRQETETRQTLRKDSSKQKLILNRRKTVREMLQRAKRVCVKRLKENNEKTGKRRFSC